METEINNVQTENKHELIFTSEINAYLRTASQWALFLAILGFIGTALMVLIGLAMTVMTGFISAFSQPLNPLGAMYPYLGLFYILIAAFYFLPSLFLCQFALKTKKGIDYNNQDSFSEGLGKLKSTFKTLGIMSIVMIVLTIIIYGILILVVVKAQSIF